MSNPSITADKTPWYQWDTDLTVTVSGGEMNECHFANRKQGTAYVQAVINGVARVPDELLQVAAPIKAYGYVSDGAGGQTYVEQSFDVIARNIPSDYTYTKTAQKTIRDAEVARDEAVQAANDAKASELAADDSAVEASTSAQSAGDSASAAATSASNAAKSAGDAATSASDAKAAAGKAVEDASGLLKTYTDNAKTSADNAATSASNAADAASAASGSASAAAQSATDASNAKVAAQTAKAGAETAASNAATSASNAATSATAAEKSAGDAAASVNAINVIAPKTVGDAPTSDHDLNVAIGDGASAVKYGSVAIGYHANAQRESVSIGDAAVSDDNSIAIGHLSAAQYNGSVALGAASKCYAQNEFSVGSIDFNREITHVSTPTAPTSAATKKYTDDNDSKTLSEANKYTDANTSNALVGTVSGKLLHVEDAWPRKPFGLTIDGAYKQEGTPSPENPVPIVVVENPVLRVTGRNLLDYTKFCGDYYVDAGTRLDAAIAAYQLDESSQGFYAERDMISWNEPHLFSTEPLPAGQYILSVAMWSDTGAGAYTIYTANSDYVVTRRVEGFQASFNEWTSANKKAISQSISVSDGERICLFVNVNGELGAVTKHFVIEHPMVTVVGDASYVTYTSKTTPITLPSEHPYLAALPDGTHDEIVIDKDGNVELVDRVGKVLVAEQALSFVNDTVPFVTFQLQIVGGKSDALISNNYKSSNYSDESGYIYSPNSIDVVIRDSRFTSLDVAKELLVDTVLYYERLTAVTYQLGKLEIPALPETISNVWTDAELTTNMSMTYKRDINIAFDNLVQAVVAAAAGE